MCLEPCCCIVSHAVGHEVGHMAGQEVGHGEVSTQLSKFKWHYVGTSTTDYHKGKALPGQLKTCIFHSLTHSKYKLTQTM